MDLLKYQYLYIKNMTDSRDMESVTEEAVNAGMWIDRVYSGSLVLDRPCTPEQRREFKRRLKKQGYLLVSGKRKRMVEAIKSEVINMIRFENRLPGNRNFSDHVSAFLGRDYSFLSGLFCSAEKTTIEKYILFQKTEKTKELLLDDSISLKEIALRLGFSNTQHLSAQFKRITGMSPSEFRHTADTRLSDEKQPETQIRGSLKTS